jgi:hypothetical protein
MSDAVDMMDYYPHDNVKRSDVWTTKDDRQLKIADMTDEHLYYAYRKFDDPRLAREVLLRLFKKEAIK